MNYIAAPIRLPLLPWRRKSREEAISAQIDLAPERAITRDDGWKDLELRLMNRCVRTVWVEDASAVLVNLDANRQAAVSSGQARHHILTNVEPNKMLTVSLAKAITDAAGRPQGPFSCLVLTNVCYRVFNEWCKVQGWRRLP